MMFILLDSPFFAYVFIQFFWDFKHFRTLQMNGDLHLQFKFYAEEEVILNYAVRKVFGFLLLSKPTECLNSTFRDSERRLLVYFEDFDHPTETQMLHHCFLAPWQFLYIGLWAANAAKRAKQQNSPLKVMAAMQNFQEELRRSRRSSSDFSFLRFFGVKLYDVIKRGGVGLQMRFTTFQCTTYTPN